MTRFQTRTTLSAIFVGTGEKYVVQFFSAHHLVQLSRRIYRNFSLLVQWSSTCAMEKRKGRKQLPEIVMESWQPEEVKMVLVVNTELGMGRGKVAAQCGHAAVACFKAALAEQPELVAAWERVGQAKVVVRGGGEEGLLGVSKTARQAGLLVAEVRDAGRSQVEAGSLTVVGLGPANNQLVDKVAGKLKLL